MAATKTAPKKSTKTAPKAERPRKEGLRKPQISILQTLAKHGVLSRKQIVDKGAVVVPTQVGDYVGTRNPNQSAETAARWPFPDLHDLGFVQIVPHEVDGRTVNGYKITAAGRTGLAKALKEEAAAALKEEAAAAKAK